MNDSIFPSIKRNLSNLIEDQEGNIPASKILVLGAMVLILGNLLSIEAFAGHRSHSSHSSHRSHSSHSSGSHGNHSNHGSHESHVSHQSHTSHSNTTSHSNSLYSAEGDVSYPAPSAGSVARVATPFVDSHTNLEPPTIKGFETPELTPTIGYMPDFAVPMASVNIPEIETELTDIEKTPIVR